MTAWAAFDLRPIAALCTTRRAAMRALLTSVLPLGLGWLGFVVAFNSVGDRADDSDFVPKLAMVGLFVLPYALGHVVGLMLGELARRPMTRLLPGRRSRGHRASLVIGVTCALLSTIALRSLAPEITFLGAYAVGWFGYAYGCAVILSGSRMPVWVGQTVLVFILLGNMPSVISWLESHALVEVGLILAAIPLHGLSFARWGERELCEAPIRRSATVRAARRPPSAAATPLDRALAIQPYESLPSPARLDFPWLLSMAALVVVLAAIGPLLALDLDPAPSQGSAGPLRQLFDAFVGIPAGGASSDRGRVGTSFAIVLCLAVLPLAPLRPFQAGGMRPFSRATLGQLAFALWWRVVLRGTAALVGVALAVTLVLGSLSGAGLPSRPPVFLASAMVLVPLGPWLAIASLWLQRWARGPDPSPSPARRMTATVASYGAALVAGAITVQLARGVTPGDLPVPGVAIAFVVVLVLVSGVACLRAAYRDDYRTTPLGG